MAIKERTWSIVKEWTTKAGLKAMILKGEWSDEVKKLAPSLFDYHTGYVEGITNKPDDLDVHGGVTFTGTMTEAPGEWIGFDLGHYGDEHIPNQQEYAEAECEKLAQQLAVK